MAANPIVLTGFANPDPNAAPLNIVELVKLLNQLVSSVIVGSYTPYVIGPSTPGAEDRDKLWFKLASTGQPLGMFTYFSGKWRRVYNGMIGEVRMYSGDPNDPVNGFDDDGLGIVQGEYDGWHLCNGKDGTIDLSDHFIVGATMNDMTKGYAGGKWKSIVEDGTTSKDKGGHNEITLTLAQIPTLGHDKIMAKLWAADGNAPSTTGDLFGVGTATDTNGATLQGGDAVAPNTAPTKVNVTNPYIALGFITFKGYTA